MLVNQFDPTGVARRQYAEASRTDPFFVPPQINAHERKRLNEMMDKAVQELRSHPAYQTPTDWGLNSYRGFNDNPILDPKKRKL